MATTASPLLPLFKEQLEAECGEIIEKYSASRGVALIYWYFRRLHEFDDAEIEEVLCDGGGDLGIDAIWADDDELVHFYQFKNPETADKGIPAGEIDKVLSGLNLILCNQHDGIANDELKSRIEDIRSRLPVGYRLHVVSSGAGLQHESRVKLDAFAEKLSGPSSALFEWDEEALPRLQERFYQQTIPAVKDPVRLSVSRNPYMLRSGVADCYFFHVSGDVLAELYEKYGEGLLQRNIRVDQRGTATNRSIEATCTGDDSANFIHFNNGVTFICETATFDGFKNSLTLEKAQIVNGGQTIRALFRATQKGSLKDDVLVPVRAITSSGDKDFANNVTVNQNNQNQVGTGFLRSNDPRVIQLDHALAAYGWYLERREGELRNATEEERAAIQRRIGQPLEGRTIRLKECAQAYTATFFGQPEMAKKNVKKIFLSADDGGYFERIFTGEMTAERVVIAHQLKAFVDEFVKQFAAIKRKVAHGEDKVPLYEAALGPGLTSEFSDIIHQVMPQCSLFVCGIVFKDFRDFQKRDPSELPEFLNASGREAIQQSIYHILDFARENKDKADRSWPVLLKSNTFFAHVSIYIQGIRKAGKKPRQRTVKKP